MKQCNICKEIKFGIQFYSTFEGYWTATYDVCTKCANKMRDEAVRQYQYKLNKRP